uniref:Uncharacterized protein n=1 Tax=Arundo donax TaxID=35708 RepID=A0A0A9C693_ARUDO
MPPVPPCRPTRPATAPFIPPLAGKGSIC